MRVNISNIAKTHGASLEIKFNEVVPGLEALDEGYIFDSPVNLEGRLANFGGMLKLKGVLNTLYTAKCFRCLKSMQCKIDVEINEDFIESEKAGVDEAYTYEGNFLELDKAVKDNIILNLPVRQLCTEDCKGLCPQCGCDLNENKCECKDENINPQMEVLKNFFK